MSDDEPIELPITDELDLHTFAPRDVAGVTEAWLDECARIGLREVRVVHGKGIGALRRLVEGVLARHPAVVSWRTDEARGGWGATVVSLRAMEVK